MRMHSRPSTHKAPARSSSGSLFTAALPFLLAATGMVLIGIALILEAGILVLAGAGIVVIAASMYFIAASLDRADRKKAARPGGSRKTGASHDLPRRGPLADAAVDALTHTEGPGGVWPPLSNRKGTTPTASQAPHAQTARAQTAPQDAGVSMWDPHGRVAPESFQQPTREPHGTAGPETRRPSPPSRHPAQADHQDALMEFQAAGQPAGPDDRHPEAQSLPTRSAAPQWDPGQEPDPENERDLRLWPGARDLGSWGHLSRSPEEERMSEKRRAASVKERRDRLAERLPTVGAILASPEKDETPPKSGATRGKCSSCQSYLWAPPQRPVTLKCPGCGHKARLY